MRSRRVAMAFNAIVEIVSDKGKYNVSVRDIFAAVGDWCSEGTLLSYLKLMDARGIIQLSHEGTVAIVEPNTAFNNMSDEQKQKFNQIKTIQEKTSVLQSGKCALDGQSILFGSGIVRDDLSFCSESCYQAFKAVPRE